MLTRIRAALSVLVLLGLAAAVRADIIYLEGGGVVKGDIVARNEEEITVKTPAGIQKIFRQDIARIEEGASGDSFYKERLKKLRSSDADGHYALGLELRKLRLDKEARECFERALKIEKNHLAAKIALEELLGRPDQELVAAVEDEKADAAPAPAVGKLPGEVFKALEEAKRATKLDDEAKRAAAWDRIRALHAEQPTPELKEAVLASIAALEKTQRKLYEKNAAKLAAGIRAYDDDGIKKRNAYRAEWEKSVEAALAVIFDLKIYPDENHGKVGQPVVDEKVLVVKKRFPAYDALVAHDVQRFRKLSEEQARTFAGIHEKSHRLLQEAKAGLEQLGGGALALKELPKAPAEGARAQWALMLYRAGRTEEAWALAERADEKDEKKVSAWEVRLLERMRDLRVADWNERVLKDATPLASGKGKRPTPEEWKQVEITNAYRQLMGRPALEIHPCLVESARGHSEEMTKLGYFAHESPVPENREPSDRAKNAGYPYGAAENISLGSVGAQATHDAWYNSSGHHRNILGQHTAMGSGLDGQHWTQNFGGHGELAR